MPIKRILIFAVLGLITGFFSMYGYLASYTYLGKIFGDGTPYFLALVGLVTGVILSKKEKKTALKIVLPIWCCILLGVLTLVIMNGLQLDFDLNFVSPIVTLGGVVLGSLIVKKMVRI